MKKVLSIICVLAAAMLMLGCNNSDEDVVFKEFKQQNAFLKEQLKFALFVMEVKANGNPGMIPYYKLFRKQDSVASTFLQTLATDKVIDEHYRTFIQQSNTVFLNAQNEAGTKVLQDDFPLTQFTFDSLLLQVSSDSLKKELIEQQVLQRYLTITQLYYSASSVCGIRFDLPDHYGYRLVIEKNKDHFLLNLKCYDRRRVPYFEKLELISLLRNDQENDYYPEHLTDITSQILESKYEKDAVSIKTNPLLKGLYKIHCNKLSVSDAGRLVKQDAYFDFEITENQ